MQHSTTRSYLGANLDNAESFIASEIQKMPREKVASLTDSSSDISRELLISYLAIYPNSFVSEAGVMVDAMRFKELAKMMASQSI